eukprot:9984738-Alexandrium_andersonii.AAC.1
MVLERGDLGKARLGAARAGARGSSSRSLELGGRAEASTALGGGRGKLVRRRGSGSRSSRGPIQVR